MKTPSDKERRRGEIILLMLVEGTQGIEARATVVKRYMKEHGHVSMETDQRLKELLKGEPA